MLNFGLIKTTVFYIICISICYFLNIKFDEWYWQIGCVISVFIYLFQRQYAIYVLILSFTIYQFQSVQVFQDTFEGGYCKIERVKIKDFSTQLFCECKNENVRFGSVIYYSGRTWFHVGEVYDVSKPFNKIRNNNLTHEFSYKEYLKKKGILYETRYVKDLHLRKLKNEGLFNKYHQVCMKFIHERLSLYFHHKEIALIMALCFGDKSQIDGETFEYFRKAGLMHIIAVSGLHVGLIQLLLLYILRFFFGKRAKSQIIQQAIVVLGLIGFAWLCRFSLSIVRSVFMFSILYYSVLSKRILLPIHGLFLSAFLVLVYNPLQVFDLGFQFSYLATFGLLLTAKYINVWTVSITNKWLKWILQASLISLIAQCFLSPLLFYYFGEIPLWFLVFNIPGFIFVTVIIILVALFFVLGAIHSGFAEVIGIVIQYCIKGFEWILSLTDYSEYTYFYFKLESILEVMMYCGILFLISGILIKLRWKWIKYAMILMLAFLMVSVFNQYKRLKINEVIVWNTNVEQSVSFKHLDTLHYYASYNLPIDERIQHYAQSMNTSIKRHICETSDVKEFSNLYKIRDVESDTIACVLFVDNKELREYFKENYTNKVVKYLFLKSKTYSGKQKGHIVLKYGPTQISESHSVYFYP